MRPPVSWKRQPGNGFRKRRFELRELSVPKAWRCLEEAVSCRNKWLDNNYLRAPYAQPEELGTD